MSDDKDEADASDWLTSQFNPTEQVPKQAPPAWGQETPAAPVPPVAAEQWPSAPSQPVPNQPVPNHLAPSQPAPSQSPFGQPASAWPSPAPTPVAPTPVAPTPNADGGFDWGLRAGGASDVRSAPSAPTPTEPTLTEPTMPTSPAFVPSPAAPATQPPVTATPAPPPLITPPLTTPEPTGYVEQPTEAYLVQPWQPTGAGTELPTDPPAEDGESTTALDALFGDHQFQEYEEIGVLGAVQAGPSGADETAREPREPLSTTQKSLIGVAAGLVAVLILFGMFFLGKHLGAASAATPTHASTSAPKNTPTPAGTGGPAAAGVQQWSALQGGECIQPFTSAWATTFTVVPCTADHDAQMVFKGKLPDGSDTAYPTMSQFQTELTALCSAPTAINYAAAATITDLQVSFSYPASESKWISGDRTYYCFIDRQSGGNLPGDLSVPSTSTTN